MHLNIPLLIPGGRQLAGDSAGIQPCSCEAACSAQGTATYSVKVEHLWPASNYRRPFGAHWSPLVVTSHSLCAVVWRNGTLATAGVKDVAELGENAQVHAEIDAFATHGLSRLTGNELNSAVATEQLFNLTVDRFHPVASALAMIAPSPDWFVGVDSVPLCNDGLWVQEVTYKLFPWDAGTDDGQLFESVDEPADPVDVIHRLRPSSSRATDLFKPSASGSIPISTLTFTLTSSDNAGLVKPADCGECTEQDECTRSYDGKAFDQSCVRSSDF